MTTFEDFPGVWPGVSAQPVERSGLIGFGVEHPSATPHMSSASKAASKMETTVTREEIDAKLERTEARVQATVADLKTEFSKFESGLTSFKSDLKDEFRSVDKRIEAMQQEMTQMRHSLPSKGFLVGTAISIVAVMIGLAAFGASQFGNGIMAASSSVSQAVNAEKMAQNALEVSNQNAEQLKLISGDIRTIATRLASERTEKPRSEQQ
jgi:uncharacterized phage infection (PIP) family protein YhgE